MLQLNHIRPIPHPDQLWQGKIVCRQYVQGYCSYGTRCKYDHPPATSGEQWFDPQPLPLCSQTSSIGRENWLSSHDPSDRRYSGGLSGDMPRPHSQYSMTRWLGNGTFLQGSKAPQSHFAPHNGPMDPKQIRSIIAWKTTPCKHFIKNNGWCPLGDACNFIHDWQLVHSNMWNKDIIRQTAESSSRPDGGHKATSHCWAHVQGFCGARNCPHFHPADIQPYIKYTPCPAWILCDKRSTCPFKHFDAVTSVSHEPELMPAQAPQPLPPPPPPPQAFYPPPAPLPAPAAYSPPSVSAHEAVEVNGTTYFPLAHDAPVADDYSSYPQTVPVAVPIPMDVSIPLPTLATTGPALSESANNPPLSSSPVYHGVPEAYEPHEEPSSKPEQVYIEAPLESSAQIPMLTENAKVNHPEPDFAKTEPEPGSAPVPGCPGAESHSDNNVSAEPDTGEHQRKRRSHGHVRRISINVKTGEVVERTLDGRHGVYGL